MRKIDDFIYKSVKEPFISSFLVSIAGACTHNPACCQKKVMTKNAFTVFFVCFVQAQIVLSYSKAACCI